MATKAKETFKVTTYLDDAIDGQIVSVGKAATTLKVKIHSLAVSTMMVWGKNKNDAKALQVAVARLNALQMASPYHSKAFSKWVAMFTNLHWSDETKVWYANVKEDNNVNKDVFKEARATPFWDVSPPPAVVPMFMHDEIMKFVARMEKRMDNPKAGDEMSKAAMKFLRSAVKASETTHPLAADVEA